MHISSVMYCLVQYAYAAAAVIALHWCIVYLVCIWGQHYTTAARGTAIYSFSDARTYTYMNVWDENRAIRYSACMYSHVVAYEYGCCSAVWTPDRGESCTTTKTTTAALLLLILLFDYCGISELLLLIILRWSPLLSRLPTADGRNWITAIPKALYTNTSQC